MTITASAYGGQSNIDECHITGSMDFGNGEVPTGHVIQIADPAYPAHLEHCDPDAYQFVYDEYGNEYCTVAVEPTNL